MDQRAVDRRQGVRSRLLMLLLALVGVFLALLTILAYWSSRK
jgi:hypothetical protein